MDLKKFSPAPSFFFFSKYLVGRFYKLSRTKEGVKNILYPLLNNVWWWYNEVRNVFLGVDILRKDDFSGGKYRRIGLKRSVGLSCQKSICIMTWGRRILRAEILKFLSFRQKRSRWHLKLHQRFPKLPCLLSGSKKQPRTKSSRVKVELIIQNS